MLDRRKQVLSGEITGRISRVGVIGAGTMGMSIAQWLAFSGVGVTLRSGRDESLRSFISSVQKYYEGRVRRGRIDQEAAGRRIASCHGTGAFAGFEQVDLVIECVAEDVELKKAIFREIDGICSDQTILATNTSSLSISVIGSATQRPESVVGLHFFQPVRFIKAVEVIVGDSTAAETVASAREFLIGLDRAPIRISDCPGFLVNRMLGVYLMGALRLVEEGQARPAEIDQALATWGMRIGPLRLADLIGLDVLLDVARIMEKSYGEKFRVSALHRELVARGHLGRKVGRGIYVYPQDAESGEDAPEAERARPEPGRPRFLVDRVVLPLIREAISCSQENLASPSDINLALVECIGLPRERLTLMDHC